MFYSFSRLLLTGLILGTSLLIAAIFFYLQRQITTSSSRYEQELAEIEKLVATKEIKLQPRQLIDAIALLFSQPVTIDYFAPDGEIIASNNPLHLGSVIVDSSSPNVNLISEKDQDSQIYLFADQNLGGINLTFPLTSSFQPWLSAFLMASFGLLTLLANFYLLTYRWRRTVKFFSGKKARPCQIWQSVLAPLQKETEARLSILQKLQQRLLPVKVILQNARLFD